MPQFRRKSPIVTAHRVPTLDELDSADAEVQAAARLCLDEAMAAHAGIVRQSLDAVDGPCLFLNAFHMELKAKPGDWIVSQSAGRIEVVSDAVFQNLYEAADG